MAEDTRAWRCACTARGTLAYETVSDVPADGQTQKNTAEDMPITVAVPRPLGDQEIGRSGTEWEWTQQQLGNLGVMAESNWALDWAERLLREVRRLRAQVPLP